MANYLRNQAPGTAFGVPDLGELKQLPALEKLQSLVSQNPEVSGAEAMRREMEARLRSAKSMAFPMLMASAFYQQRMDNMPDSVGGMIGFSIPLYYAGKQKHEIAMNQAMVNRATLDTAAMKAMAVSSLESAWYDASAAEKELTALTGESLPRFREAVISSEAQYISGQGDYLMLLEALSSLLDEEQRHISQEIAVRSARFRLSHILGFPIEE